MSDLRGKFFYLRSNLTTGVLFLAITLLGVAMFRSWIFRINQENTDVGTTFPGLEFAREIFSQSIKAETYDVDLLMSGFQPLHVLLLNSHGASFKCFQYSEF